MLLLPLALLIAVVWPGFPLWGYSHSVTSEGGHVTITSLPLFQVLSDNYYPALIRMGYALIFGLEILAPLCSLSFFVVYLFKKKDIARKLLYTGLALSMALELMVILCFYSYTNILILASVMLALHFAETVWNVMYYKNHKEETPSKSSSD